MHNTRVSSHHQHQPAYEQKHHQHSSSSSVNSTTTAAASRNFTNTAKLPIETVKLLIAAVSRKPHLWIRTNNGQKRSDINALWHQVSQEVHLPAEICRIKWGHLRDNFRKVFIRNTLSAEPPTTWRFYNDMRFMEPAVAENVMRHHRLREQSLYWQELHHVGQRQQVASAALPETKYEHSLQNQLNFSEFAAIFQNSATANKRIKLEASETSQASLQDSMTMPFNALTPHEKFYSTNHNNIDVDEDGIGVGSREDEYEDDDDDDQFDEDAVSAEESLSNVNDKSSNDKDLNSLVNADGNLSNFNMRQDMATNTDTCPELPEGDSDRMFLLSLLPYLRKVKEHRKLQVRQKLQDVLIEEFG